LIYFVSKKGGDCTKRKKGKEFPIFPLSLSNSLFLLDTIGRRGGGRA